MLVAWTEKLRHSSRSYGYGYGYGVGRAAMAEDSSSTDGVSSGSSSATRDDRLEDFCGFGYGYGYGRSRTGRDSANIGTSAVDRVDAQRMLGQAGGLAAAGRSGGADSGLASSSPLVDLDKCEDVEVNDAVQEEAGREEHEEVATALATTEDPYTFIISPIPLADMDPSPQDEHGSAGDCDQVRREDLLAYFQSVRSVEQEELASSECQKLPAFGSDVFGCADIEHVRTRRRRKRRKFTASEACPPAV